MKEEIKFKPKHILGNILAIIMFFADYASDIWVIGNYNIFLIAQIDDDFCNCLVRFRKRSNSISVTKKSVRQFKT